MAPRPAWNRLLALALAGLAALAALALIVAGAGWLAFVPSPQAPPYRFSHAWGEPGTGPGRFRDPTGIAVAGGEVFVADGRNGRIQVFDRRGRFRRQFGRERLGRPMNLAAAGSELYVADYWHDRVDIFALDGTFRRSVGGGEGPGALASPGGVAVGPGGDLYIADTYRHRVRRLRPDGAPVRQWGTPGRTGAGPGQFSYPTDVALAADGTLYVADGYNDRVQAFAPDGRLFARWGGPFARNVHGPFPGWFATVTSVAVGPRGRVFTADFYNDRVQVFAPDGTFLTAFGRAGDGPGRFGHAMALDVAADGTVFVTDLRHQRVQVWQPAGE